MALAEREVIDGIEQVGFTHAVVSEEAVDLRRAVNVGLMDVFIVQDGEFVQYHFIQRYDACDVARARGKNKFEISGSRPFGQKITFAP